MDRAPREGSRTHRHIGGATQLPGVKAVRGDRFGKRVDIAESEAVAELLSALFSAARWRACRQRSACRSGEGAGTVRATGCRPPIPGPSRRCRA
ncbi:hypothetical protein O1M54_29120 [Streptomyces diastatochromogenes]|nr:hypothetical protein [Streptomyces diastatochromogenes]